MKKMLGMLILALLTAFPAWGEGAPPKDLLTVTVFNVLQGDALLVQFPGGQHMLIDAGPRDAGPGLVAALRERGIRKIDVLVSTHPHEDHLGGMEAVLKAFDIGKVWDSGYVHGSRTQRRFLQTIRDKGIRYGKPRRGFSEEIGGATVEVLGPGELLEDTGSDVNNNCLLLRIAYGNISFLFMGDAERAERQSVGPFPPSTVLKVSHHGSHNGTDKALLQQVKPRVAVICYAVGNPYGHPHKEVVKALKAAKIPFYGTPEGDIILTTDGEDLDIHQGELQDTGPADGTVTPSGSQEPAALDVPAAYVGNRKSQVFHRTSCEALPSPGNRVFFETAEDAEKEGYTPCPRCKP